jgi:hypothetical protein
MDQLQCTSRTIISMSQSLYVSYAVKSLLGHSRHTRAVHRWYVSSATHVLPLRSTCLHSESRCCSATWIPLCPSMRCCCRARSISERVTCHGSMVPEAVTRSWNALAGPYNAHNHAVSGKSGDILQSTAGGMLSWSTALCCYSQRSLKPTRHARLVLSTSFCADQHDDVACMLRAIRVQRVHGRLLHTASLHNMLPVCDAVPDVSWLCSMHTC